MSTDISPYTSLKSAVAMALDEEEKSISSFDRCWILGLRGLVKLTFSISGQPETVRLPVSGNKTVSFPAGLLSWSKIGIMDDNGQINTLKINNALTTFRDNNHNRLNQLTSDINTSIGSLALVPYYANFYYGGNCYNLFGVGNGVITYGDCKVDEKNRVIILEPNFRYGSILVEGIMCPEKDNDYQIPTCLQEAVIMFIRWKLKLAKREEFYAEATEARRSLPKKKVILQTLNQVLRESDSMKLRS